MLVKNNIEKRDMIESAVIMSFALIAGSTRMIEVFPHSTLKGLLLSASTGSFCSLASKQIINEKCELKRWIRVTTSYIASVIFVIPTATKLLKSERYSIGFLAGTRLGVVATVINTSSCGVHFILKRSDVPRQPPEPESKYDKDERLVALLSDKQVNFKVIQNRLDRDSNVTATVSDQELVDLLNAYNKQGWSANRIREHLQRGNPRLYAFPASNDNYKASLRIALHGIINETNQRKKDDNFDKLFGAFYGCDATAQRGVAEVAEKYLSFEGGFEDFLFVQVYSLMNRTLESTIRHHHQVSGEEELTAIKSRYLKELSDRRIYLPQYQTAGSDPAMQRAPLPPFVPEGIETYQRMLKEGLHDFVIQLSLDLSKNDEDIPRWLQDFGNENRMRGFGYYSEGKKNQGHYEGHEDPTEDQEWSFCPYVSRREVVTLLESHGLLSS